jgi:hypothetical protein
MRCIRKTILLLTVIPTLALAQAPKDTDWTQGFMLKGNALSFGGAYRALADTTAAILYNPAGIAQKKGTISLSGDYAHNGSTKSHVIGGAVVDTQATDVVAFGLSYDRDNPSIGGIRETIQQITLAAAMEAYQMFFFGASVKGYFTSTGTAFQENPDGVDVDAGVLVKPFPMVSLALTAQNLAQGRTYAEFPTHLGFGGAVTLEPHARLAIDVDKNFNTNQGNGLNAYFGGELRMVEGIYLRGGFGLDRVRSNNFYSIAAAAQGPKISLLFCFSQRLNPTSEVYAANIELYF